MNKGTGQLLAIVVIIALFAGSWYTLINESKKQTEIYNNYLEVARDKAGRKIFDEATQNYMAALGMNDSLELRDEIAQYYFDSKLFGDYTAFCQETITKYPEESLGYERLSKYYIDNESYYDFFSLVNIAAKRKVSSDVIDGYYKELEYKYETTYVEYDSVREFSGGYCAVMREDGKWGYINPYGTKSLNYVYSDAKSFGDCELVAVKAVDSETKNEEYRLIDNAGSLKAIDISNRNIEDCGTVVSDKIAVKYGGKYHYCNKDLDEMFGSYDYAGAFYCGVAAVEENGKWYVINEEGKKVSDNEYEDIKLDERGIAFKNNVAFAKKNGSYILIDTSGNQVGSGKWDDADTFSSDQPAAVKKGNSWGYVDTQGNEVVACQYESAKSFANGFAAIQKNNKWGYICIDDYSVVIPCEYEGANDFNDCGSTFVFNGTKWTLIKIYRLSREK